MNHFRSFTNLQSNSLEDCIRNVILYIPYNCLFMYYLKDSYRRSRSVAESVRGYDNVSYLP